ncbi:SDR family NAD(P)-dependent oxidoreductase [Nonomuraea jabiensis]|uniref:NAD(P)-dependent dehydrogenase (Short-subunit alcohol dehydrogenase family) n=1 Tax=Nonomuraea jabiensis TaxID=882448 RepID=A0A7W9LG03_9ACTN|nr:SDR family oxidoreductase [Nonomuraea jabiensis]MBB5782426.1 NAD(P)-dependent dehydrogenase (short-subunit alcohol dehydrogenase family) [Nonomuraea jabiensis]
MSVTPVPVRSPLPTGLAGSTVVLIGGTSGIGLSAGVLLGGVGARVVLVGRDQARLAAAVDRVREAAPAGGPADSVLGVSADGSDEDALAEVFEQAGQVDHVLVTAGGIGGAGPVTELSRDDLRSVLDARLWGAFAAARLAAARLPAGGSITFTSGTYVLRPVPGMTGPLAAVGAVETFTRALAVELAPKRLRVNAIRYGSFDTPLLRTVSGLDGDAAVAKAGEGTPLGRFGTAEEAAASALFVMANNYVTGQVITVDGGQSLA